MVGAFRRNVGSTLAVAILLSASGKALAGGVTAEIGYDDLVARLGAANVPTGMSIVVGQVEAPESPGNYGPDQSNSEFIGKTFTAMSGSPGNSSHATLVGQTMYGTVTSIAPGITSIFLYEASNWATTGYLRTNQGAAFPPLATPGGIKMFNNSWIGSFGNATVDNDCLRRADFVVTRDQLILVNGVNNGGPQQPLMAQGFNGIAVGLTNGTHTSGPTSGSYDGPGRMKPEIVAPAGFTSFACPIIDASCSLLFQTANTDPSVSGNVNAKRSETIKAAVLTGANHRPGWTNNPATSGPNRGVTATPLDPVYGVDEININRSHLILTGGEQAGSTTVPASVTALDRGWDLTNVPVGNGLYYRFHVGAIADKVSILATWNRDVASNFAGYTMKNHDLRLWRVDASNQLVTLVGDPGLPYFGGGNVVSQSFVDNVEHLYITNLQPSDYVLQINRNDSLPGNTDVTVAWLLPKRLGDVNGDGFVNTTDLLSVINGWGACPPPCAPSCPADLTGDCVVNSADLLQVINNWG